MTEEHRSTRQYGTCLFYLSTGRSNIYNFPNVWFPCKSVNLESGKVEKFEWIIQPWMYQIYKEATRKRKLDGVTKEFMKKFNSPDGVKNMIVSLSFCSWKECIPNVALSLEQLDSNELDEFAKDIKDLEIYLTTKTP